MPEGLPQIIALLSIGYIFLILELFVPGGILGALGGISIAYGCYLAFGLGAGWGFSALGLSVLVTVILVRTFVKSRTARRLVLSGEEPKSWKAQDTSLTELVDQEGRTLSPLRPAGLAEIGEERVDVVTDSEFLHTGVLVRVVEVEGNRVVVEAAEGASDADSEDAEPEDAESEDTDPEDTESEDTESGDTESGA